MTRRAIKLLSILLVFASLLACTVPGLRRQPTPTADVVEPLDLTPPSTATQAPAETPTEAPSPTPSPSPTPLPTPLPPTEPLLVSRMPERGEEQPVDAPLVIVFDQAMDQASVKESFAIEPPVKGQLKWNGPRTVSFVPDEAWERAAEYRVHVDPKAKSADGLPLRKEVAFRFTTTGFLEVTQVQPVPNAREIDPDGRITVMFNRPVVPLVAVDQMGDLPQPLVIDPPVEGEGEWLNTSIYTWRPTEGLLPSTVYRATIPAGLEDTTGGLLAKDYSWTFATQLPRVASVSPLDGSLYVGPTDVISVTFNQPMDRDSVQEHFSLIERGGPAVPGTFDWSDEDSVLLFTPRPALERGLYLSANIEAGALGAVGTEGTVKDYRWTFSTAPLPRVTKMTPADGATGVNPYAGVYVKFSAPMERDALADNLTIEYHDPNRQETGTLTPTLVYSYWHQYDTELSLSFSMRASSRYTVTLGAGLMDKWGTPIEAAAGGGNAAVSRFSTRKLDPSCYFAMPGRVGTLDAYTTTTAVIGYRNVSQLNLELYRVPSRNFMLLASDAYRAWDNVGKGQFEPVHSWSIPVSPPLNRTQVRRIRVQAADGGSPAPGLYYLEVRAPEMVYNEDRRPAGYVMAVTRSNVLIKRSDDTAMVWVTDLQSGQPVPGAGVQLRTLSTEDPDKGSGVTDGDGIYRGEGLDVDLWTGLFALTERDGELTVGYTRWEEGITPWEYGLPARYYSEPYQAMLYTDRPVYRPGQTVYYKGILRKDDDARYSLPAPGVEVDVVVSDSQGRDVYSDTLSLSEMGTLHGELALDDEASLGYYSVRARYDDHWFSASFQVAEYRKPEFQVKVQTDRDQYVHGDTIQVTALATYYFGGAVAGAQARWAVLSQDYAFQYDGPGRYSWREWEWTARRDEETYGGYGALIAEGTAETDAEGRVTFSVPADVADKINSQVYTLEVTVTDVNAQEVSSRTQTVVHKGLFYVGLAPRRYVGKAGEEQIVDVRVVDLVQAPVADQEVEVVFMKRRWYSAQKQGPDGRFYWEWEVEETPVHTVTARTDGEGNAEASFVPEEGGSYKVRGIAEDERGNEVRSAAYFWVSSSEWISWRRENHDRIELIADKDEYQVGDTAEILVPSPFRGPVVALLTVERGQILEHRVLTLEGNSEIIRVPIIDPHVPNVFVSVVLVKGVDDSNPLSSFKMGYVALPVSIDVKKLDVTLTPDRGVSGRDVEGGERYGPRDTVQYDVLVTDHTGQGVETELSLDLVDLSVLALAGGDRGVSLEDQFYRERGIGIQTSSSLIVSIDRVAAELPTDEGKGGGGGPGAGGDGLVRTQFADTAYWNPVVRTDAEGRATVEVKLPDNLTTWRMRGRGITADTLVGEGTVDVVSSLALMVRPVAPRFFVVGDRAILSVVVHNNTDDAVVPRVALEAAGLIAEGGPQTVVLPAHDKVKLDWPVTVEDVEQVVLKASAEADGLADAIELTLPVFKYSTPEVVATAGTIDAPDQRLEAVVLPQSLDPTQGELKVQIDPSLAAGMVDGLNYLEHYPYECVEQTVSRWLPNVLTYKALRDLDLDHPRLKAELPDMVGTGLQRLYSQQHYDGGWGWWRYGKSDPNLTAYVLLGMAKAQQADFYVEPSVIDAAKKYLRGQFKGPSSLVQGYKLNQQAFILYALAEVDAADLLPRAVRLMEDRDRLSVYAQAYLAMSLGILDGPDSEHVQTVLSDLHNASILSATGAHWEEEWVDRWAMNTDTRTTAIVVAALSRLDPDDALLPNAVRWLMVARKSGHWETTQETAWALIGLTEYMVATGELKADYGYELAFNGQPLQEGVVTPDDVRRSTVVEIPIVDLLQQATNQVGVTRTEPRPGEAGEGRLYYALYLRTFKPVEDVKALSRGIVVARQYQAVDCDEEVCDGLAEAAVGEVVRVKITLVAPNDLHFLVLEDPLPAGTEAVDRSLKTTSVVSEGPQLESDDRWGWGWRWFTHSEIRDEKVALFADYLPRGTYEYTYLLRASVPGEFLSQPTVAYEMYFPEVWGRSDGGTFTVGE